jgi:hypothetical protein
MNNTIQKETVKRGLWRRPVLAGFLQPVSAGQRLLVVGRPEGIVSGGA